MEEALQQLVTDSLDLSRRKSTGPAGQITVTMDTRALAPDHRIFFRNLHKFRVSQMNEGVDLTELSDEQWGMVQLDKCHHISTTSTSKDGPQSFRVRICKTCCQEDSHIELGTYVDQESAILVNDTFEILNERLDRLIVLRVEDKPDLHYLVAKKYDRSKGRDYACILDLIAERITAIEGKKRKPSVSEMIPAFAKRSGEAGSTGSAENGSNSTCSTSSEASDELRTASRVSTTKTLSVTNSHASLHSALSGTNSRTNSARKRDSGRRISISSAPDEEVASNSGSASTIDDEITVTEEHNENNATNAALRELSSVCYQRLLSPSIASIVAGSADLSTGTLVAGTSMFNQSSGPSELIRSMEKVRTSSNLSSLGSAARRAVDKFNLGSPFSASTDACASPTSNTTAVHNYSGFNSSVGSAERQVPSSSGHSHHTTAEKSNGSSTLKRSRGAAQDDSADAASSTAGASAGGASYASNYDRLVVDGQTPRKRAATFSVSEPYPYYSAYQAEQNPIATLTWLASMEDVEVDVARSLYELRGNSGSSLFDTRGAPGGTSMMGALDHRFALHGGYGNSADDGEDGNDGEMGDGSYDQDLSDRYAHNRYSHDGYGEQDNDNGDEDSDGEMDEHDLAQMDLYYRQHGVGGSKPYGYPTTFHHNGQAYQHSMGGPNGTTMSNGGAGGNGGFTRMRSSSMSMIERSEAAWAILGNTGGYRSKMDPLSMALKKYHERGGSANAAAQGFVGIYSPEDRKSRIMRFLEKRKRRMWTKKVKYDVRKNFADSRVRVKGRFVKKQDEDDAASPGDRDSKLNTSHTSHTSHASNSSYDPDTSYYQEDGDDAQDEEPVRATTPAHHQGLNIKLKVTKSSSSATGSGSKRRESKGESSTNRGEGKGDSKSDKVDSKGEGKGEGKNELKLTFSSRRRRHGSVGEESELTASTSATAAAGADHHAEGHDPNSGSPAAPWR